MTFDTLSYWQSTALTIPLSTDLPTTVDVTVIGGGIIGASTCYWLAKEGISVALLERNKLASGATGRNGGFVVAGPAGVYQSAIKRVGHETAREILELTCKSQALLRQVIEEEEIKCDYREPGAIRLAISDMQLKNSHIEMEALKSDGLPISFVNREDVQALIKTPITHEVLGGQFLPKQGLVHSAQLVQGIVRASLRHQAKVYHAELLEMKSNGNYITLHTSRGKLQAGKVIVAINAWTSKLFPEFTSTIIPIREQMLAYAPIAPIFAQSIVTELVDCEYFQQTPNGAILIGGCNSVEEKVNFGQWITKPTALVQNALEQILPRIFPKLAKLYVTQRWAGLLDYTTDHIPIVDKVPNMPGAFVVAGLSGHGMPFGMKFGQLLTATIKNGNIAPELKPYRLNRPTLKKWDI